MTLPAPVRPLIPLREIETRSAVAEIVHDLNNTLSTVVGFSELMLDKPDILDDRATALRYLEAIRLAGRDASRKVARLQSEWWPAPLATPGNPLPAPAAGRELTILLIDDDERVRSVIADCLTGDGHQVEVAAGGEAGLAMLMTHRFDLVITDRAMPGMDGHLVASAVKRLAPGTAVMMLTGFGEAMKSEVGQPPDVDLVVSKPLTLSDLRQALVTVQR